VSRDARELVQHILTPDPQQRPTLHEIVDHVFFTDGIVPGLIPMSAHDSVPEFRYISRAQSEINLARLRRYALLDEDQVTTISVPSAPQNTTAMSGVNSSLGTSKLKNSMTSSIAQQEKEFQKAVQPGSPISALLSSARQPLLMSTNGTRESPLLRKLQAAAPPAKSPTRMRGGRGLQNIEEEDDTAALRGTRMKAENESRKKELESQKARIVAQMVPGNTAPSTYARDELENVPPVPLKDTKGKQRAKEVVRDEPAPAQAPVLKLNGFDAAAQTLTVAFDAKAVGRLFRDPREDINIPDERVFIVSWVDYCNKYGMGYALTDGSVGVHFNDSTTLVLSPDKKCVLFLLYISELFV
jgi:cell cycle serine/threonine-protein kinase CDC5/MSD2